MRQVGKLAARLGRLLAEEPRLAEDIRESARRAVASVPKGRNFH
jgi:hypothetical protein